MLQSLVHTSHFFRVEFNPIKCGNNAIVESDVALVSNLVQNCRVRRSAENVFNIEHNTFNDLPLNWRSIVWCQQVEFPNKGSEDQMNWRFWLERTARWVERHLQPKVVLRLDKLHTVWFFNSWKNVRNSINKIIPKSLAYGGCARSMTGSHNLAVLPKQHDNSLFLRR